MAFEKREGTGALFANDKKASNHPDWRGYVIISGIEYELAGWDKNGTRGHFISMTAKVKTERRDPPQGSITERATAKIKRPDPISSGLPPKRSIIPDDDDSIPF